MSTTDPKPYRKQRQKESNLKSHPAQNGAERLKTVVRRLPPNLPEEVFWQSVHAWVTDETVAWKAYHPGKLRTKRLNKEGVPSRAYIAFKSEAHLVAFSRAYDGHVFRDKAGNESHAVVEYAPFQKVPIEKKKVDARNNTIDKDDDYLSFLETLKGGAKTESLSLEALIAASQPPPPPTTTPLLEALKAEKSALKDKETILRNHAHYKDPGVSGVPSSKKEEGLKKKAVAATAPSAAAAAAKSETAAVTGRKGRKAAAHKATLQDGQGQSGSGKGPAGVVVVPPTGAKPPTAAAASSGGHGARHRPPREPHGRAQVAKGETSTAPASALTLVAAPGSGSGLTVPPTNVSEPTPVSPPAHGPGQRKNRPVVGLGRHFEAALSGAGVAVSPGPGERKRRDKGGDSGPGGGAGPGPGSTEAAKSGKQKHKEERAHPPEVVPSILQRPVETVSADVQRSQSPRGVEGSAVHVEGSTGGPGGGRGSARRGRVRRGGHRGG